MNSLIFPRFLRIISYACVLTISATFQLAAVNNETKEEPKKSKAELWQEKIIKLIGEEAFDLLPLEIETSFKDTSLQVADFIENHPEKWSYPLLITYLRMLLYQDVTSKSTNRLAEDFRWVMLCLVIAKAAADYRICAGLSSQKTMTEQYELLFTHLKGCILRHDHKKPFEGMKFTETIKFAANFAKKLKLVHLPSTEWIEHATDYISLSDFINSKIYFAKSNSFRIDPYKIDLNKSLAEQLNEKNPFFHSYIIQHCSIENSWNTFLNMDWEKFWNHDFKTFGEIGFYAISEKYNRYFARLIYEVNGENKLEKEEDDSDDEEGPLIRKWNAGSNCATKVKKQETKQEIKQEIKEEIKEITEEMKDLNINNNNENNENKEDQQN